MVVLPMFGGNEIKFAGKVVDWLVEGLQYLLPENVEAKLEKVVLAGHSKGVHGRTAFAVALGYAKTNLKFSPACYGLNFNLNIPMMKHQCCPNVCAFLRAHLNQQSKDFDAIFADSNLAPAKLDDVIYIPA
ncbi:Chlorophyllase-2, chloroplastic, partial [Mucuna pruriens]